MYRRPSLGFEMMMMVIVIIHQKIFCVSQAVTGVLNVIKMSRQCLLPPGEEGDQPMSRSRTLLDDLPDDGHPVRHHTALPLPDVVEGVEKKVCFTSDCHPLEQNVRQSHISHPMSPDVVVCVEEEVDGQLDRLRVQLLLLLGIAAHWSAVGTCKLKKDRIMKKWARVKLE